MTISKKTNQKLTKVRVLRQRRKGKQNAYVFFEKQEKNGNNSGGYGSCQAAESSRTIDEKDVIGINKKKGKRGRKEYIYQDRHYTSVSEFKTEIKENHAKYKHFNLASKAPVVFYKREVDGKQTLCATMHTYYKDGVNLKSYLKNNQNLSFAEKLKLMLAVTKQLQEQFHSKYWIHSDIKLANIIYNAETREAFYVDVDFAERIKNTQKTRRIACGTPGHLPRLHEEHAWNYQDMCAIAVVNIQILLAGTEYRLTNQKFTYDEATFIETICFNRQQYNVPSPTKLILDKLAAFLKDKKYVLQVAPYRDLINGLFAVLCGIDPVPDAQMLVSKLQEAVNFSNFIPNGVNTESSSDSWDEELSATDDELPAINSNIIMREVGNVSDNNGNSSVSHTSLLRVQLASSIDKNSVIDSASKNAYARPSIAKSGLVTTVGLSLGAGAITTGSVKLTGGIGLISGAVFAAASPALLAGLAVMLIVGIVAVGVTVGLLAAQSGFFCGGKKGKPDQLKVDSLTHGSNNLM